MKILLIEDDRLTADFVKLALDRDGHEIEHATTASEGLNFARTNAYDALILDLGLPDMNGYAVASALRNENKSLPILMLTAASKTENIVEGLDAGADDYLTKPFDITELRARVRALLRRRRA